MKFSITIPAYKQMYIKECIDSCIAQTYTDFELIIVNDHSPEDLDSIVKQYDDPRIRYYVNEQNCGAVNVVDNWNKCLEYAKGEYIICMGDDDKLLPCCLEEYVKLIDKYPNHGVYHMHTEIIDEKSQFMDIQESRPELESVYSLIWHRFKGRKQYIGDFLFHTETLRKNNGFYKIPLATFSDDISVVMAARYNGIANSQVTGFQYREHRHTISRTGNYRTIAYSAKTAHKWFKEFLKEEPANDIDKKYHKLLVPMVERVYNRWYKDMLDVDMRTSNPLSSCRYWLNVRKDFGFSVIKIIKLCLHYSKVRLLSR